MKKKFLIITLGLGVLLSFPINVHAADMPIGNESEISLLAEETGYYYRYTNGILERRLWSFTKGIWLNDWEPAV